MFQVRQIAYIWDNFRNLLVLWGTQVDGFFDKKQAKSTKLDLDT